MATASNIGGFFIDDDENIYLTSEDDQVAYKFINGSLTPIIIAGVYGSYGSAELNKLRYPSHIFKDKKGFIYIADTWYGRIMKITEGNLNGEVFASGLSYPHGIFVDSVGTVFVSERGSYYGSPENSNRISFWRPGSTTRETLVGGNGEGSGVNQFNYPLGITVDKNGNIFVADRYNARIQKITPNATAKLIRSQNINIGSSANLQIDFTGIGPYTFTMNGIEYNNITQNPYLLSVSPDTTTEYYLTSVDGVCGFGAVQGIGYAKVTVDPQILCSSGALINELEINGTSATSFEAKWLKNLTNVTKYQYRYKDVSENNWSTITDNTSQYFFGVQNLTPGKSYHYQVKAVCQNSQETSWVTSPTIYLQKEQPTIQYPSTVITNILTNGQSIQVEGKRFTPNGNAELEIRGIGGFGQNYIVTTNLNGEFNQLVDVTPTMQSGSYTIKGVDYGVTAGARVAATTSTQGTPANRTLDFKVNMTSDIPTISIEMAKFDDSNVFVHFFWRDFIGVLPHYNTYLNSGGDRKVQFKVEFGREISPGNIIWLQTQPIIDSYVKSVESKLFHEKIYFNSALSAGNYVVRVTDLIKLTNTKISIPFKFVPVTPSIVIEKHWDFTYPAYRDSPINSIAADGVSRFYLKTKISNSLVTNVKLELMDENNSSSPSTTLLGKLKIATNPIFWSDEANDASQKTIFVNSKIGDSFWSWYVAPDNFADGNLTTPSIYSYKSQRTVKVKITGYSSTNVELISKIEEITIIRPPLYLVHGLGGKGGSNGTWANFSYNSANNTRELFVKNLSSVFPDVYYPQMEASSAHNTNSDIFLSPLQNNDNRSFQTKIINLRKNGKVVSAFDYVAHSMGGCMLRSAIDDATKFYVNNNYGKGYVHKFITLTTPHNGSPLGDIVNDIAKEEYFKGIRGEFKDRLTKSDGPLSSYFKLNLENEVLGASPAVKAFVMASGKGGIKFKSVDKTKSHVIVSDYITENTQEGSRSSISNLDYGEDGKTGLNLLAGLIKDAARIKATKLKQELVLYSLNKIDKEIVNYGSLPQELLNTSQETADFMNYYSGYLVPTMNNYLFESDIIVPLSSQLASLSITASNVTHNKIGVGGNYLNFKANHDFLPDKICSDDVVGDRVFKLLNADVTSNLFGGLGASPNYSSSTTNNITMNGTNDKSNSISSPVEQFIESRRNIAKVKIDTPIDQAIILFDTEDDIRTYVSDTNNLVSSKIIVGGNIRPLPGTNSNNTKYLFDNINLGKQTIYLEAIYSYGLDSLITYWDSVSVNINNNETPQSLALSQQDMYIFKGDTLSLNLGLNYTTYSGSINRVCC